MLLGIAGASCLREVGGRGHRARRVSCRSPSVQRGGPLLEGSRDDHDSRSAGPVGSPVILSAGAAAPRLRSSEASELSGRRRAPDAESLAMLLWGWQSPGLPSVRRIHRAPATRIRGTAQQEHLYVTRGLTWAIAGGSSLPPRHRPTTRMPRGQTGSIMGKDRKPQRINSVDSDGRDRSQINQETTHGQQDDLNSLHENSFVRATVCSLEQQPNWASTTPSARRQPSCFPAAPGHLAPD